MRALVARAQAATPFFKFHAVKFATLAVGTPLWLAHRPFAPAFTALNVLEAVAQDLALKKYRNAAFGAALAATTPQFCSGDRRQALAWALAYTVWHVQFAVNVGSPLNMALAHDLICLAITACAPAQDTTAVWGASRTTSILLLQAGAVLR